MTKILRTPIALAVPAVLALALLSSGCKDNAYSAPVPLAAPIALPLPVPERDSTITYPRLSSPIGRVPDGPTQETPGTTSPAKSEVSKADQSAAMPLPGQANDHSVMLPNWTQKPKNSP
jgi:hypothetical protein